MRLDLDPEYGENIHFINKKAKGKIPPITGHRGPEVLDGVGGQRHASANLPLERPGTHHIGVWVGPKGRSGQVQKISPHTGIRSPDCPARCKSLYQLCYPSPCISLIVNYFETPFVWLYNVAHS
jgi:hypothetical protein